MAEEVPVELLNGPSTGTNGISGMNVPNGDAMYMTNKVDDVGVVFEDEMPGGLADEKFPGDFDREQLERGMKVEMEHTNDVLKALEIAMDHLTEDPKYYDKLEMVEKKATGPMDVPSSGIPYANRLGLDSNDEQAHEKLVGGPDDVELADARPDEQRVQEEYFSTEESVGPDLSGFSFLGFGDNKMDKVLAELSDNLKRLGYENRAETIGGIRKVAQGEYGDVDIGPRSISRLHGQLFSLGAFVAVKWSGETSGGDPAIWKGKVEKYDPAAKTYTISWPDLPNEPPSIGVKQDRLSSAVDWVNMPEETTAPAKAPAKTPAKRTAPTATSTSEVAGGTFEAAKDDYGATYKVYSDGTIELTSDTYAKNGVPKGKAWDKNDPAWKGMMETLRGQPGQENLGQGTADAAATTKFEAGEQVEVKFGEEWHNGTIIKQVPGKSDTWHVNVDGKGYTTHYTNIRRPGAGASTEGFKAPGGFEVVPEKEMEDYYDKESGETKYRKVSVNNRTVGYHPEGGQPMVMTVEELTFSDGTIPAGSFVPLQSGEEWKKLAEQNKNIPEDTLASIKALEAGFGPNFTKKEIRALGYGRVGSRSAQGTREERGQRRRVRKQQRDAWKARRKALRGGGSREERKKNRDKRRMLRRQRRG